MPADRQTDLSQNEFLAFSARLVADEMSNNSRTAAELLAGLSQTVIDACETYAKAVLARDRPSAQLVANRIAGGIEHFPDEAADVRWGVRNALASGALLLRSDPQITYKEAREARGSAPRVFVLEARAAVDGYGSEPASLA